MENNNTYPYLSEFQLQLYKSLIPHYESLVAKTGCQPFIRQHLKDIKHWVATGKFYHND